MACSLHRYMTARLLGDKDLHIIRAYDKRPPAVQEDQLDEVRFPPSSSVPPSPEPAPLFRAPCMRDRRSDTLRNYLRGIQ